jgi:hypothetical protein
MSKYMLSCACGRQHTVETRQAGEIVACECGATVAVPTLRQLRELPAAPSDAASAGAAGPSWGVRQRVITVCLLLAAAFLVVAGVSRALQKPVPTLDAAKYTENVEWMVGKLTPLQAWERWYDSYEPLRTTGFEVYRHPAEAAMQQALTNHQWTQGIAMVLAAVCFVVAAIAWLAKSGRQGD